MGDFSQVDLHFTPISQMFHLLSNNLLMNTKEVTSMVILKAKVGKEIRKRLNVLSKKLPERQEQEA